MQSESLFQYIELLQHRLDLFGHFMQGFMMLAPSRDDVLRTLGHSDSLHSSLTTFCSSFGAIIRDIHTWLVRCWCQSVQMQHLLSMQNKKQNEKQKNLSSCCFSALPCWCSSGLFEIHHSVCVCAMYLKASVHSNFHTR